MSREGVYHLVQELTGMVGNSSLSDVILVTKGNYHIPAHSFMLSIRSKTLAEASYVTLHYGISLIAKVVPFPTPHPQAPGPQKVSTVP